MSRALSLTCTALLLIGFSGSAFAKPSIAVLGLEVVDQNGTPTPADTQAAKELSDGLRARAKAGTGPYTLAPGSDKELIDQKLLNNCDNEASACMSAIGNQLGSDILMYGHFEKQGKQYQVTIKVLDVGRKAVLKSSSDMIPLSEANGASLQGWAKKIYAKLTGESGGATLVVKVSNADRGTILIDGDPKGTFSNGSGTVSGLPDGKARLSVESEGFRRWEKDVTIGGGSLTVPVELEKGSSGALDQTPNPNGDPLVGPTGPGPEGKKSNLGWKISAGVGGLVMIGGLWYAYDNWSGYNDLKDDQCAHGLVPPGSKETCPKTGTTPPPAWTDAEVAQSNKDVDSYEKKANIGWGIAAVGAAWTAFSVYKVVTSDTSPKERQSARGKRQRKDRTYIVTPTASPKGGGATLRFDW
jgi:hypothetical protein